MLDFIKGLSPKQCEGMAEAPRYPPTFIAEDFDDVVAILNYLKAERIKENLFADGA